MPRVIATHSETKPAAQVSPVLRRNLVLGMAWRLELDDLILFSKSFRRVAPTADVVLLAKEVDTRAQALAGQEKIQLIPLTSCYYGLVKSSSTRVRKESLKRIRNYLGIKLFKCIITLAYPLLRIGYTREECHELRRETEKLVIHTYSSRFIQYLDFLRNNQMQYDKVMLTDVRDVFFQADPFEQITSNQLWMFLEHGTATLATQPRNRRWVEATFGRNVLRQIGHQPVICAGITMGGMKNVLGYLEAMEPELLARTPVYIPDQGIHNAMAHTGAFKHLNPLIVKNGDGPVLTVGMMEDSEMQLDSDNQLTGFRGKPYPVIHQYDRHPKLVSAFKNQLAE